MSYFFHPFCSISPPRQRLPGLMRRKRGELEEGRTIEKIKSWIKMRYCSEHSSPREEVGEGTGQPHRDLGPLLRGHASLRDWATVWVTRGDGGGQGGVSEEVTWRRHLHILEGGKQEKEF